MHDSRIQNLPWRNEIRSQDHSGAFLQLTTTIGFTKKKKRNNQRTYQRKCSKETLLQEKTRKKEI